MALLLQEGFFVIVHNALPYFCCGQAIYIQKGHIFLFPEPFPFQRQKMVQVIRKEFPGTDRISRLAEEQKSVFLRKKLQTGTIISGWY